jgi:hypothetical protein
MDHIASGHGHLHGKPLDNSSSTAHIQASGGAWGARLMAIGVAVAGLAGDLRMRPS